MPERSPLPAFSEKAFYLQEFRGRTLAFAMGSGAWGAAESVPVVLSELAANATRCVLIGDDAEALEKCVGSPPLAAGSPGLPGGIWRQLRERAVAGVRTAPGAASGGFAGDVALQLGVGKLVLLDPRGGLERPGGGRASFVSLAELHAFADGSRREILAEIRRLLEAGLPAVNLCSPAGLAEELFSYSGSGTLFTRERYVVARRLGVDDFDAAADLVARGVEEGYLAPRPPEAVDRVLASGFGAFVEGVHLAGIGALLAHPSGRTGEIASLYTLTRFLGEGVGGDLVAFALEEAGRRGLERVFACTTSERVGAFFERNGFAAVGPDALPAGKWQGYDPERRQRLLCFARDVAAR